MMKDNDDYNRSWTHMDVSMCGLKFGNLMQKDFFFLSGRDREHQVLVSCAQKSTNHVAHIRRMSTWRAVLHFARSPSHCNVIIDQNKWMSRQGIEMIQSPHGSSKWLCPIFITPLLSALLLLLLDCLCSLQGDVRPSRQNQFSLHMSWFKLLRSESSAVISCPTLGAGVWAANQGQNIKHRPIFLKSYLTFTSGWTYRLCNHFNGHSEFMVPFLCDPHLPDETFKLTTA